MKSFLEKFQNKKVSHYQLIKIQYRKKIQNLNL